MSRLEILTQREYDVLKQYMTGYGVREVADYLDITDHTVKTHMRHIYAKLSASNARQAATILGWVKPPPRTGTVSGEGLIEPTP